MPVPFFLNEKTLSETCKTTGFQVEGFILFSKTKVYSIFFKIGNHLICPKVLKAWKILSALLVTDCIKWTQSQRD